MYSMAQYLGIIDATGRLGVKFLRFFFSSVCSEEGLGEKVDKRRYDMINFF